LDCRFKAWAWGPQFCVNRVVFIGIVIHFYTLPKFVKLTICLHACMGMWWAHQVMYSSPKLPMCNAEIMSCTHAMEIEKWMWNPSKWSFEKNPCVSPSFLGQMRWSRTFWKGEIKGNNFHV
jgi:hypothetical protein